LKGKFLTMFRFPVILFVLFTWEVQAQQTGDIRVVIKNIQGKGNIIVQLYDAAHADDFPKHAVQTRILPVTGPEMETVFKNLSYGRYAVTVTDDANANGKLDFYFFGPPKEKVLASRYAKGHFGPPDFKDAAFDLNMPRKQIVIDFNHKK